ncbi:MAG: purine-nucleoside phosphorylase [Planctomycetota bacterium]|jgi:purine-nucleoside phosphorylase|nr:purine-nucleoside phosphorylase [Planctomycetota bacterium]
MPDHYDRIQSAKKYIRSLTKLKPDFGVILGTGLGGFTRKLKHKIEIPYGDIPGFQSSAVEGHAGVLVIGKVKDRVVLVMEGRVHAYEGHSLAEITFPVRVMKALGAKVMIVTAASGGMNPIFCRGDIMILDDHINLMGLNPLIGPNDDRLGPRFPDMCEPYDQKLIATVEEIAKRERIKLQKGVYVAVVGPCLETRAEYRLLRAAGADVVGMSTVPEVIVAVHAGLRTIGLTVVTDECLPDALEPCSIEEVVAAANAAAPDLERLIEKTIAEAKL